MDTPANPLPRSVRWFAPWRWRPWKRWALCGLLLVALVAYPLSIGPALILVGHHIASEETVGMVYRPVLWAWCRSSQPISRMGYSYTVWWNQDGAFCVMDNHSLWECRRSKDCTVIEYIP